MNTIVPGPDSGEQKTDKKMRNFSLLFFLEAKRLLLELGHDFMQCCGSGSGIRSGSRVQTHIFVNLITIFFWMKSTVVLCKFIKKIFFPSKIK
jgi:hypothetical protein